MLDLETLRVLLALVRQCESNGWEPTNKGEDAHGDARCHLSLSLSALDKANSQDPVRKEIRKYFSSRGTPDFSADELDPPWAWREDPPDKGCVTQADGSCVGTKGCMHDE